MVLDCRLDLEKRFNSDGFLGGFLAFILIRITCYGHLWSYLVDLKTLNLLIKSWAVPAEELENSIKNYFNISITYELIYKKMSVATLVVYMSPLLVV